MYRRQFTSMKIYTPYAIEKQTRQKNAKKVNKSTTRSTFSTDRMLSSRHLATCRDDDSDAGAGRL